MAWKKNVWLGLLAVLVVPLIFEAESEAKKTIPAKLSAKKAVVGKQVSVMIAKSFMDTENVSYASSDSTVASVNAVGVVTAKKPGKTKIKIKCSGYEPMV